jgi:hypothetical protein
LCLEAVQTYRLSTIKRIQIPLVLRWGFYIFLIWSIIFSGEFGQKEFIYFAF